MARLARIVVLGPPYHMTPRGNCRRWVLKREPRPGTPEQTGRNRRMSKRMHCHRNANADADWSLGREALWGRADVTGANSRARICSKDDAATARSNKIKDFKAHRLTVIDPLKPLAREFAPVSG